MINTSNDNTENKKIESELQEYTNRLGFLRNEVARLEGVVLYLQNQLQQQSKK